MGCNPQVAERAKEFALNGLKEVISAAAGEWVTLPHPEGEGYRNSAFIRKLIRSGGVSIRERRCFFYTQREDKKNGTPHNFDIN